MMARRKKEPPFVHRDTIADAAERLFTKHGIAGTSMDEIAKEAGYSKATLYVYFMHKEELVDVLALRSMRLLLEHIRSAMGSYTQTKEQYLALCWALADYQAQSPFYFEIALGEIRGDAAADHPVEREIFAAGEAINAEIARFIMTGISGGALRKNLLIPQTIFLFWASLSGLILMAARKSEYIASAMQITVQEFLAYGFETLYRSIQREEIGDDETNVAGDSGQSAS